MDKIQVIGLGFPVQIPEGLKPPEVERSNGRVKPPIPYVPEMIDEIDPDRKHEPKARGSR